jgi:RibD C-terminal domain
VSTSVLDMSVSRDGYIADPDDFLGGENGRRLHKWDRSLCPVTARPGPAARWRYPLVTRVTDGIRSAMEQGNAAAGDRDVPVRGAYTGQRALEARLLDEVQIHQIPVLLGRGRRLFDELPSEIELQIVRVIDTPEATHIRYGMPGDSSHSISGVIAANTASTSPRAKAS